MNRIKKILVGVDLSPSSLDALTRARRLAARTGAEVEVVSVVDSFFVEELHELTQEPIAEIAAVALREHSRRLADLLEDAKVPTEEVRTQVLLGSPFSVLLERSRELGADLVVLGRHGRGAKVGWPGVGSLASKCVRKLPSKIMLVARGETEAPRRVVACVDMSSTSRGALRQAITLAVSERRPLDIVNVYPPPWLAPKSAEAARLQREEHKRLAKERLGVFLHGFGGVLRELEVEQRVVEGEDAAKVITAMLEASDLAVIGTRGRTVAAKEIILGGTADRIVRDSPASILAIKPEGFDYGGS